MHRSCWSGVITCRPGEPTGPGLARFVEFSRDWQDGWFRDHQYCIVTVALFPRITIMAPGDNPLAHQPIVPPFITPLTPPTRDVDPLKVALYFAAICEADIKPKDRRRMEEKIST